MSKQLNMNEFKVSDLIKWFVFIFHLKCFDLSTHTPYKDETHVCCSK